jgi:prepilin-type N-terminal cleavage/methylation domain-containing protein
MYKSKNAFTLIEVMIAVMIISVVIMALIQMQGNTTNIFSKLNNTIKTNQYTSLFVSNSTYGFEDKKVYLDDLLNEFSLEDDLRRKLNKIKVEVDYEELRSIDMREDANNTSDIVFEIGKTHLKADDFSASLVRFKIQ